MFCRNQPLSSWEPNRRESGQHLQGSRARVAGKAWGSLTAEAWKGPVLRFAHEDTVFQQERQQFALPVIFSREQMQKQSSCAFIGYLGMHQYYQKYLKDKSYVRYVTHPSTGIPSSPVKGALCGHSTDGPCHFKCHFVVIEYGLCKL